ncbi:MAG: hypothetical protein KDA61_21980, partial [Planctomycetales bacterium]|nr:hypothetical protein [Planctomycetales bacterium]
EAYRLDWTYEQRRKMFDRGAARSNVRSTAQADRFENARIEAAWTEKLEQFVLAWIARALDASFSKGIESSSNSDVTLEVPSDGEIAAIWRAAIPGRLEGALGSQTAASPTSVEFTRVIVKSRPRSVHGFYLRQLSGAISRPTETGRWLDWIDPAPPAGQSRSIDVLIRASGFRDSPSNDGRDEEERVAIDILVISARRFVD